MLAAVGAASWFLLVLCIGRVRIHAERAPAPSQARSSRGCRTRAARGGFSLADGLTYTIWFSSVGGTAGLRATSSVRPEAATVACGATDLPTPFGLAFMASMSAQNLRIFGATTLRNRDPLKMP